MANSAALSPEAALQQLKWRYAVKKFDASQQIPDEIWHTLEQSLVLAPSSFGLQPWKFFVVKNPELRAQLLPHTWNQAQVVDASHLVVLAIKKDLNGADVDRYVQRMAEVQGTPVEALEGFGKMVKGFMGNIDVDTWSAKQVYIALGQYMTTAAMLGIDTCPIEGFVPAKYDEVLGLPEKGYSAVVVCPAGYRAADDKYAERPKVRFVTEEVVEYLN
ncbi:NAD(P)H-dependent oxidoreductase [Alkalinema sp. FACHB-956]|uniref:NAD(P)H-dependent oxidoreductase n=1 Tax=Alkalinema sp. FACHB-956 TaxID=2692768 RepID=UPI001686738C|nr:NAD(P)H-dependent oxidoreductase [Alkalinema sp. FACHB-956]MBD2330020.1 NAD(P)H-dependent oxidoreductase [Alkalinema sp. FACHB-956]